MHGVEPVPAVAEPLGGGDGAVVEAARQGEARGRSGVGHLVRRRVVRREQHHARAAPTFAAAELGAGEAGAGAEEVEEGGARVDAVAVAELEALAVDREDHRCRRSRLRRGSHLRKRGVRVRRACSGIGFPCGIAQASLSTDPIRSHAALTVKSQ